jgi:hypothetical protein
MVGREEFGNLAGANAENRPKIEVIGAFWTIRKIIS